MSYKSLLLISLIGLAATLAQVNGDCLEKLIDAEKLVGKTVEEDENPNKPRLAKIYRQFDPDADVIKTSTIPRPYRILGPRSMATMDYLPDRINIHVDGDKKIRYTRCG